MSITPDAHIGSSFDSFLEEVGILDEVDAMAMAILEDAELNRICDERMGQRPVKVSLDDL